MGWGVDSDRFEDSSPNANYGYCGSSNTNPDWRTTDCPTVDLSGRLANGQSFDGVDDEILIGQRSSSNWAFDASFTIAFWMKAPDYDIQTGNQIIVGRDDDTDHLHWWVGIDDKADTVDVAAFALIPNNGGATTAPTLIGTTDISDGNWHFVVAVRDAVNMKNLLYVDGVLEGAECEAVVEDQDFSAAGYVTFGYMNFNGTSDFHYEGVLDEVAIYNSALPPSVVAKQYDNGVLARGYCNEAPKITGQIPISIVEDTARAIALADLTVSDPDNTWPGDFALMVEDGVNYTRSGNTITPAENFSGALTVKLKVNDGGYTSNTWSLSVHVTAVNDVPVVGDIPDQKVDEGTAFAPIKLDDYVTDADAEDADSAIKWTYTGNTALTVIISDRVATVSAPTADWSGTETITFRATDTGGVGGIGILFSEDSAVFTVTKKSVEPEPDGGGGGGGGGCFISSTGFGLFR